MRIQTFVTALLFAVAAPAIQSAPRGGDLLVVPGSQLAGAIRLSDPLPSHLVIGSGIRVQYGCVNIALTVESNGDLIAPMQMLAYRFNKSVGAFETVPTKAFLAAHAALTQRDWTPVTPANGAIFTSVSLPVRSSEFDKTLSSAASSALDTYLVTACDVPDLYERAKSRQIRLNDGPKLPPLETILRDSQDRPNNSSKPTPLRGAA